MPGSAQKQVVDVDGRRVALTSLDKVLYPGTGFTKGQVLAYYTAVAGALVPLAAGRPVTRKRWPDGVGTAEAPGEMFFVKNLEGHAPDWLPRRALVTHHSTNTYPLLLDRATLVWLAQTAALELHVPQWRFRDDGSPANPDRLVLDLDPGEGAGLAECAEVARLIRPILEGMGLAPLPVTSGSKGIHLYAPLPGEQTSDEVTEVAHALARMLEGDHPDLVVSDMKRSIRAGKVLVDWSQNRAAKTTLVPYSLRGTLRPGAAAPRTWEELDDEGLRQLTPDEVVERLERDGDLLAALVPERDPLARYRSMRDAGRTPEPGVREVAAPSTGRGDSFVIQEHHARRLHWDFRLERDGVLVSWALPRGVPGLGERNHLAVHTEDHPLDYASFEGEIPKGEYGGGSVLRFDAGTYTAEKWRDGEVIATLAGAPDGGLGGGPVRVALVRTGEASPRAGQDPSDHSGEQWLIHRMALPEPATPAARSEPLPRPVRPMLAAAAPAGGPNRDEAWSIEMKWDGVRALAEVRDGVVALTSRNELDLTATYPELQALARAVGASSAVLDGEILALDATGRPSFALLQQRFGLTRPGDVERARRAAPVQLFLFDLLEVDGEPVTAVPHAERRRRLERLLSPEPGIEIPPAVGAGTGGDLPELVARALATSRALGLEGLVLKRTDSRYRPGARTSDWLKVKHERTQEVVVGGWRPGDGRRSGGVGSLLVGIPGPDGLEYVGRVGSGFSDEELERVGARLAERTADTAPFVDVPRPDARDAHWVVPDLVGEVRFAEWTGAGRLRQPSWRGWRPDKRPEDVVREPEAAVAPRG
ncbi:ATP-dependent DNA ligase [Amnibacterium sp. CER49]|uniref:ATP-dependent DNA ligase n=1 Tax=Amnibacterium sp. CER49 TaxID=3039161 RepID=UPI002447F51E|nr:ATP-dependent DNA ligase [Amnibacterium sp. CER49]MDH2445048.1 ATP-dependent DNA ligase [Amnibacterium sp. CER49]